jgi:putative oxidoreductase
MHMARTEVTRSGFGGMIQRIYTLFELIPYSLLALGARIAVALFFYRSALTRVDQKIDLGIINFPLPWAVKDSQSFIFGDYKYFGSSLPESLNGIVMHLTIWAECVIPILLILGIASRFSAFILGVMALGIGLAIFPQFLTKESLHFAVLAFIIVKGGGGKISVDWLLKLGGGRR